MEEKINNQKIFYYVPPIVAKLIIDSDLTDSDVFFNNSGKNNNININTNKITSKTQNNSPSKNSKPKKNINKLLLRHDSQFIKPNIFPISNILDNSLVMLIRLKGFEKLIYSFMMDDKKNQKERLYSEYVSLILSRIILKISGILSENGGEIVKYNDFEILVMWNFSAVPINKLLKYKKFYSKYALITAIEIMKKFDDSEIFGTKIEISIGIGIGESEIVFFGGERKRSEFVVLGEAIEQAEVCIENSLEHEIVISKEMNSLFKMGQELNTRELKNQFDQKSYFVLDDLFEDTIKNFDAYKGIKLNNSNIYMNKSIYENLSKKVYILSSILPQGLIKYLDVENEENLKELNILTIETVQISISLDLIDDINLIQNLIFDIQKATYMTYGSLIYISKTYNGLLIRCTWGIDPGNFIDNPSRAISTAVLFGHLTKYYNIKIGIGISTGACFSGLIGIQGNRKAFTLIGKKVNFSRTLADEALSNVMKSELKYLIYCDKLTMKHSQKTYRHSFVSKIKVYLDKENDLFFKSRDDFCAKKKSGIMRKENKEGKNMGNFKKRRMTRREIVRKSKSIDYKNLSINNETNEKYEIGNKQSKLIQEIFSPIENEELFLPNVNDPFPLIRTHLYNSFNPMNKTTNFFIMNSNNTKNIKNNNNLREEEEQTEKSLRKLKKSQTIFGFSKELKKIIYIMDTTLKQNQKQFIVVRGPPGVGKSLFIRKALNNFIGYNEFLSSNYFKGKEFLFCNLINPFTTSLPYNTVSFILRKIYLYITKFNLIKTLFKNTKDIVLEFNDLEHISFILSLGKNDINVKKDFDNINKKKSKSNKKQKEEEKENDEIRNLLKFKMNSIIARLEGPFNYQNIDKLNIFFFEMIKVYKNFLQKTFSVNNKKFICPLIFVIEDVQKSNNFAFEFIQFLFSKEDSSLNPFILIMAQQTPIHWEYNSFWVNKSMELFISTFSDYSNAINQDKIMAIDIKPLSDKKQIEKLIVFYFKDLVMNNYKTNLETVDSQILDFLLYKSFNGIPLLVISLFKSLIKSEKFIQTLSAEFIITSDLIDDNKMLDWSDILLPFEFDKYCSMKINSILNFKETLIFKYACIIGTIFDLQTLDKLNPLNSIIKIKDLEKVMEKLEKEHIIEIFSKFKESNKRGNIFCKINFPFMREVFHQKFPIEYRKSMHMKVANIISTDKKVNYFSNESNILILHRHLLISENDVVNEVEGNRSNIIKTVKDISQNKPVLKYNNLKILLVKTLYSRFCYPTSDNVLEGNLELYFKSKWLRISYYIERKGKIYFNQKDLKKGTLTNILIFSIEDIYKNHILKNVDENKFKCLNVLEISVSTTSQPLMKKNKKIYYFRSEQREELSKLDIAINFLKVKVNYEKFVGYYGELKFPIYRLKWYVKNKVNKYISTIETKPNKKRKSIDKSDYSMTDKLLDESNNYYKSFNILFNTSLSIFLGTIQEKLINKPQKDEKNKQEQINPFLIPKNTITYSFLYNFTIPEHLYHKMNRYLKELEKKGLITYRPQEEIILEEPKNEGMLLNENKSNKNKIKKEYISQPKNPLKKENVSQPKKSKKEKNPLKSPNKTKKRNKSVETNKAELKEIKENKEQKNEINILKKKNNNFNPDEEISISDVNSENSDKKNEVTNVTDEKDSFNSLLNELLQNKNVQINKEIQNNNNIIINNKSRNTKSTNTKIESIIPVNDKISFHEDFIPLTERTNDRSHIQYIDTKSNKTTKKLQYLKTICDFDISSVKTNTNTVKYNRELRFKTLSDDPKYEYLESKRIVKNSKIHKSNLFVNIKKTNK